MVTKGQYAFNSTIEGLLVYDFQNFDGLLKKIDTLDGGGQYAEIFKNLLIVGSEHTHIFDISDINNIVKKAYTTFACRGFKADSATNYLYQVTSGGSDAYFDVIDLTKYVRVVGIQKKPVNGPQLSE